MTPRGLALVGAYVVGMILICWALSGCSTPVLVTTPGAQVNAQLRTGTTLVVTPDGTITMGRVSAQGIVGAVVEGAVKGATLP